jgi:ankyrin repeat protein
MRRPVDRGIDCERSWPERPVAVLNEWIDSPAQRRVMLMTAHRLIAPAPRLPRAIGLALALLLAGCGEESQVAAEKTDPPLVVAAESGDLPRVVALLDARTDADSRDLCQWTPLMKAALYGHTEVARQLLAAGAQPELADTGGYTALMLAASNNHHETVRLLLDHGAALDRVEVTGGVNALIWAAKRGHIETVRILLAAGARTDLRDRQGRSALDWAESRGEPDLVAAIAGGRAGLAGGNGAG